MICESDAENADTYHQSSEQKIVKLEELNNAMESEDQWHIRAQW
jgi:hypothetical protein